MVYVFGIVGFVSGFALGLGAIAVFLRNRSRRELLQDKSLRWTFGFGVWVIAGLCAWAAVQVHTLYF